MCAEWDESGAGRGPTSKASEEPASLGRSEGTPAARGRDEEPELAPSPSVSCSKSADGEQIVAAYIDLVRAYHATLDLVSDRGLEEFERHVADARTYARLIRELAGPAPTIVDVGSGVGIPGIVIAALLPAARVVLVERRKRRAAFLELAVGRLALARAEVFGGDVRDVNGVRADVITAQAVAGLAEIVRMTRHFHADPCFLVSRRGPDWRRELPAVWEALGASRGVNSEDADTIRSDSTSADSTSADSTRVDSTRVHSGSADTGGANAGASPYPAGAEVIEEALEHRGSLVALRLPGGTACPSSG